MEENDTPETDQVGRFQETGQSQAIFLEDDDEDVHVCRKCKMAFNDIQKYLEHKIKHDNYKVKYCRSDVDKRMIMPKLLQKTVKKEPKHAADIKLDGTQNDDEKENENGTQKKRGKRGRTRASEVHSQDLVIKDKPVYICEKCDKKFNRQATLRRHMEYDHADDDDDDDNESMEDDDRDDDYKPTIADIKIEIDEDRRMDKQMEEETLVEMDSLDQVIMAAAMMEEAERGEQQIVIQQAPGEQTRAIMEHPAVFTAPSGTHVDTTVVEEVELVASPAKYQKLTDEEKAARKYSCVLCGNKFKEVTVLKTHMLTHTAVRDYPCTYEDCSYSFKTKGSLKRHIRRHTGERPYPCDLCGRNFAESGALTRHLKSRTPCTDKSDNDLPRYGKKWTYVPSMPAASGQSSMNVVQLNAFGNRRVSADTPEINKDTMIQPVPEMSESLEPEEGGTEESLSSITHVVQVLEDTMHSEQHKELFDLDQHDSVEIVISGDVETGVETDITNRDINGQFEARTKDNTDQISTVCKICHEDLLFVEPLKVHLRTHLADNASRCWLCHFVSQSKEQFENHMLMHHHVQLKSTDPFTNLVPLEEETNEKDKETNKNKSEIHRDAQMAVKQLLELPQDPVEPQEPAYTGSQNEARVLYKCPVCLRKFRGNNYLKLHMRNHTGLRPHKCAVCDKSFITKDTLTKHMSAHQDDRNFKCGECGKLFKRLSHVREHIIIHSGTRPFPCTVCEKSFKTNNAMKVHLRTHTDILPYECTFCHRRFREKGSVMRHTRMHTGEKPYECRYCGRSFAEHGTLNRHLKAKVSCTSQLQEARQNNRDDTDYTVLTEFSSVVADTQQYIVPDGDERQDDDSHVHPDDSQQAAEYVVVETNDEGEPIQNVEIIAGENGVHSMIEGVQVTDDYIVINDPDGSGMRILDSTTGETVAIVPVPNSEEADEVQTITMSQEGEVSTVTWTPGMEIQTAEEFVQVEQLIDTQEEVGQILDTTPEEIEQTTDTSQEEMDETLKNVHSEMLQTVEIVPMEGQTVGQIIDNVQSQVSQIIDNVQVDIEHAPNHTDEMVETTIVEGLS